MRSFNEFVESQNKRQTIQKYGNKFFGRPNEEAAMHGGHSLYWWLGNVSRIKREQTAGVFQDYLLEKGIEAEVFSHLTYIFVRWDE
jgi:hypothetical protein